MNQRITTHLHRKKRNLRVFPTAIDNGFIAGGRNGAGDEQDYNDTFERQGKHRGGVKYVSWVRLMACFTLLQGKSGLLRCSLEWSREIIIIIKMHIHQTRLELSRRHSEVVLFGDGISIRKSHTIHFYQR